MFNPCSIRDFLLIEKKILTLNDTVERASLVSKTLFASAESSEVLGGLGYNVSKQFELDSALSDAADCDIEEDLGVGHVDGL